MKFKLYGRRNGEVTSLAGWKLLVLIANFPGSKVVEDICYGGFIQVQEYVNFVVIYGEMLNWGLISLSQSVWLARPVSRLPLFLTGET